MAKATNNNQGNSKAAKPEAKTPVTENKATKVAKSEAAKIAKELGVDTLYENTKGEFFTSENLAHHSEGGIKKNVKKHSFDVTVTTEEKPTGTYLNGEPKASRTDAIKQALATSTGTAAEGDNLSDLTGKGLDVDVEGGNA